MNLIVMINTKLKSFLHRVGLLMVVLLALGFILVFFIIPIVSHYNLMKPEKTFIPAGYTGDVKVYLDSPDGEEKEFLNGYRVLRIPHSGILYTQFRPNMGSQFTDRPRKLFYYYSKCDTMKLRTIYHCIDLEPKDSLTRDEIVVSGFGVGKTQTDQVVEFYKVDSLWKVFDKCIHWIERKIEQEVQ